MFKFSIYFFIRNGSEIVAKIGHQPDGFYVGILLIAVMIDLFSRKVVGWSMDSRMKVKLVNDTLLMAIWQRILSKRLIWYTD
jgi:transposase InsO family protein